MMSAPLPVSPKKSLQKEKTRDCLSATSEHVSCFSPQRKIKPLVARRATSFTSGNALVGKKVVIRGGMGSRIRLVSFDKEARVMGHVVTREEMSPDDIFNTWYTKDDFKEMKKQYLPIVKKLAKKLPLDEGEEARGLEHKTPRGCKSRQNNRFQAMDAVLDEQERQWEMERKDADYIAQIYRQSSAHCQMNAYLLAQKDTEFVEQEKEAGGAMEKRDTSQESNDENQSVLLPQTPELRPASFRSRAPEESPTTPVRKDSSKKVSILSPSQVMPSPQLLRLE